ncbi:MAG: glutamate-cysteine ligase family protein [Coriobacteriaceae bacterium]|nr:glutamate-cysteine ligase family protein [Coriobacteriaceae bacterium]
MEKTPENQPCRQDNIRAIVDWILDGADGKSTRVGIEMEHQVLHGDGGTRVGYSEEHGIEWLLGEMSATWDEKIYEGEHLMGLARTIDGIRETVTLEPGGQVELSAGPFNDLFTALEVLSDFEDELRGHLEPVGELAVQMGYAPIDKAADIELIPKKRYQFMDKHFAEIGPYGTCMMRGSASTQVSIDFANRKEAIRKMRLAYCAAPIIAMMCDNTVMFEGDLREHYVIRTEIWNGVDQARCGIIPGVLDDDWSLDKYAEWILDTPAIVAIDEEGNTVNDERTFGEIFAERVMSEDDVAHAISMVFPDVRLKQYIEFRTPDALPAKYAAAIAALIKGCFYADSALDALDDLFKGVTRKDVILGKMALMSDGYEAQIYGQKAWQIAEKLNIIAKLNLTKEERDVLEPLTTYAFSHVTLAEMTVFE